MTFFYYYYYYYYYCCCFDKSRSKFPIAVRTDTPGSYTFATALRSSSLQSCRNIVLLGQYGHL